MDETPATPRWRALAGVLLGLALVALLVGRATGVMGSGGQILAEDEPSATPAATPPSSVGVSESTPTSGSTPGERRGAKPREGPGPRGGGDRHAGRWGARRTRAGPARQEAREGGRACTVPRQQLQRARRLPHRSARQQAPVRLGDGPHAGDRRAAGEPGRRRRRFPGVRDGAVPRLQATDRRRVRRLPGALDGPRGRSATPSPGARPPGTSWTRGRSRSPTSAAAGCRCPTCCSSTRSRASRSTSSTSTTRRATRSAATTSAGGTSRPGSRRPWRGG